MSTDRPRMPGIVGEVGRNLVTGTARAGLFATLTAAAMILSALVLVRGVVGVSRHAHEIADAGGAVHVVEAPGAVDAGRCEALGDLQGVVGAGALRATGTPIIFQVAPGTPVTQYQATPGLLRVLGVPQAATIAGVAMSDQAAQVVGAYAGDRLVTTIGTTTTVSALVPYPEDGRSRELGFALLAPVPASGTFDACWVSVWPVGTLDESLLTYPVNTTSDSAQASTRLLNSTYGTTFDPTRAIAEQPRMLSLSLAALAGLTIGAVSVRVRRLEHASALHAGMPRVAVTAQVLLETAAWVCAAALVSGTVVLGAAVLDNPDPPGPARWAGMQCVLIVSGTAVLGALAALASVHEGRLFAYVRSRA